MSSFKKIGSRSDAESFVESVDWHDAFVREIYLVSPSFVTTSGSSKGGIYSFGALPTARCLICSTSKESPATELMFTEIEKFGLNFATDIDIGITWEGQSIVWKFQRNSRPSIKCREIGYRQLDSGALGDQQRYEFAPVFEDDDREQL